MLSSSQVTSRELIDLRLNMKWKCAIKGQNFLLFYSNFITDNLTAEMGIEVANVCCQFTSKFPRRIPNISTCTAKKTQTMIKRSKLEYSGHAFGTSIPISTGEDICTNIIVSKKLTLLTKRRTLNVYENESI